MLSLVALLATLAVPLAGQAFPITWGSNTIDAGGTNGGPALQLDGGAATVDSDTVQAGGIVGGFSYLASIVCNTPVLANSGSIYLQGSNDNTNWTTLAVPSPATIDGGTTLAASLLTVSTGLPYLRVVEVGVATLTTAGPLECSGTVTSLPGVSPNPMVNSLISSGPITANELNGAAAGGTGADAGLWFTLNSTLQNPNNDTYAYQWFNGPPDGGPIFGLDAVGVMYLETIPNSIYGKTWTPIIDEDAVGAPGGQDWDAGIGIVGGCLGGLCSALNIGNNSALAQGYLLSVYNGYPPPFGSLGARVFTLDYNGEVTTAGVDAGTLSVGGGTILKFVGATTCNLSTAECNAPMPGSNASTHCTCSIDLASNTIVGCNAKADAGAVSAYGFTASTGVATIYCFQ